MAAAEVAHRRLHRMVAGELDRLQAKPPRLDEHVVARRRGGLLRARGVGEVALLGPAIEARYRTISPGIVPAGRAGEQRRASAAVPAIQSATVARTAASRSAQFGRRFSPQASSALASAAAVALIEEPQLRRRHRLREVGVEPRFVDVVEEREERIEVFLRERVELVVVAAAALEREAEERRAERGHAVVDVGDAILLLDRPALASPAGCSRLNAVASTCSSVAFGRRSPATCQSANWSQGRFSLNALITQSRHGHMVGPRPVDLEAVAVGVAGEVHPVGGHPLAVARAGKQPVEQFLVGVGRRVGDEGLDLGRRRRQAGDVERRPADERAAIGLGLEGEAALGELRRHDRVDRMARRCAAAAGSPA